jgi:hypothetical protein
MRPGTTRPVNHYVSVSVGRRAALGLRHYGLVGSIISGRCSIYKPENMDHKNILMAIIYLFDSINLT